MDCCITGFVQQAHGNDHDLISEIYIVSVNGHELSWMITIIN